MPGAPRLPGKLMPLPHAQYARLHAGHAADANPAWRESMEDAAVIENLPAGGVFLAVYDGHGGAAAADLSARVLHDEFADALSDGYPADDAFRMAYAATDKQTRAARMFTTGAVAVTAFVRPGAHSLAVANAGDARAVLGSHDGCAARLSVDHKPCDPDEAARVADAGAFVCGGRVNGCLAVSRALGDHAMKSAVVSDPHITEVVLTEQHRFLILACDGLWDVVDDETAVAFVNEALDEDAGLDPHSIAHRLVRLALAEGTTDNVSVVVAVFDR